MDETLIAGNFSGSGCAALGASSGKLETMSVGTNGRGDVKGISMDGGADRGNVLVAWIDHPSMNLGVPRPLAGGSDSVRTNVVALSDMRSDNNGGRGTSSEWLLGILVGGKGGSTISSPTAIDFAIYGTLEGRSQRVLNGVHGLASALVVRDGSGSHVLVGAGMGGSDPMRMEALQRDSNFLGLQGRRLYSFADMMANKPALKPVVVTPVVCFDDEDLHILSDQESILLARAMIFHFSDFWPTLPALHEWISKQWKDLITGKIVDGSSGDVAVDEYHCYKEDVELLKDMGMDACRWLAQRCNQQIWSGLLQQRNQQTPQT